MTLRERLVASVTDIRDRGRRLVELNLELLVTELKEKGRKFGAAIGLFVTAGLLALYAIGFALATIVVLIHLALPLWASLLIVTVALFVVVAILVLVGRDQLRKIGTPQPEAAVAEAKATADMLTSNVRQTADGVRARLRPTRRGRAADVLPPRPSDGPPPGGPSGPDAPTPGSPPPGFPPPPASPPSAGATGPGSAGAASTRTGES
ncbi:MAG: phage holin family protein [Actinobacteria bacterium]|nr:phage holin family protein [Actinomycetota bacterium]